VHPAQRRRRTQQHEGQEFWGGERKPGLWVVGTWVLMGLSGQPSRPGQG
jgi:hypothetical protein